MRLFLPLVCAAAALTPAVAAAQAASPVTQDARCLLTMVALSNSSDQQASHLGQLGVVYFAGRVTAREPNYNFAQLKTLAKSMTAEIAQTELRRCGPLVESSLQGIQTALAPPAGAKPPASAAPPPAKVPGK